MVDELAKELGIPLHPEKRQLFSSIVTYVGFLWNIDLKSVEIPDKKKAKYRAKIRSLIEAIRNANGKCALKELQSVHGSLMHCTFVLRDGRAYLTKIQGFMNAFKERNAFARLNCPKSVLGELDWWLKTLEAPQVKRSLAPLSVNDEFEFWVDASTDWGIGIVYSWNGAVCWDSWRWKDGGCSGERNIGWAEMVGLEFVVYAALGFGLHDTRVKIRGDNQGSLAALEKRASRNAPTNDSIKRITSSAAPYSLYFDQVYVNTKTNLADGPSRGLPSSSTTFRPLSFEIPLALVDFLYHVSDFRSSYPSGSVPSSQSGSRPLAADFLD